MKQHHDTRGAHSAQPQKTPITLETTEDLARAWREDLFKPELTIEQLIQAKDKFQHDVVNLKTAMLVMTKTPVDLLEFGLKDIESFEHMSSMVSDAAEYAKLALEIAEAAQMRMMTTTAKLLQEIEV